jgi:hypothetical protein
MKWKTDLSVMKKQHKDKCACVYFKWNNATKRLTAVVVIFIFILLVPSYV